MKINNLTYISRLLKGHCYKLENCNANQCINASRSLLCFGPVTVVFIRLQMVQQVLISVLVLLFTSSKHCQARRTTC